MDGSLTDRSLFIFYLMSGSSILLRTYLLYLPSNVYGGLVCGYYYTTVIVRDSVPIINFVHWWAGGREKWKLTWWIWDCNQSIYPSMEDDSSCIFMFLIRDASPSMEYRQGRRLLSWWKKISLSTRWRVLTWHRVHKLRIWSRSLFLALLAFSFSFPRTENVKPLSALIFAFGLVTDLMSFMNGTGLQSQPQSQAPLPHCNHGSKGEGGNSTHTLEMSVLERCSHQANNANKGGSCPTMAEKCIRSRVNFNIPRFSPKHISHLHNAVKCAQHTQKDRWTCENCCFLLG